METFKELINASQPVLVDFYADWCGPCKAMNPIIKEVAQTVQGKARVIKVDIDKSEAAAGTYGVQAVPTFILFKNGSIVWRHAGMIDKNSLLNVIQEHSMATHG
ncbi:MAG TPA: thioredoxin [Chitinophagaceae bacterium]